MNIIGIDPGKKGALVFLCDNRKPLTFIMPLIGNQFDMRQFRVLLGNGYIADRSQYHVFIEDVHAIFGSAAGATFNFGFICGAIQGIVSSFGFSYTLVGPKLWQKVIYQGIPEIRKPSIKIITGKRAGKTTKGRLNTKAMSLLAAKRLFPNVNLLASGRCKKPHDGIVDALLIAEYGRRTLNENIS